MIIRPSFTVLSGAAIGLVAGAAVYGAVSSAATQTVKPVKAVVAVAPAPAAHCAKGQKLEDGVCVIHVVRDVAAPAAAAGQALTTPRVPGSAQNANPATGSTASGHVATPSGNAAGAPAGAAKVQAPADDTTEGAKEGSALDNSADLAANHDSIVAFH